MKEILNRYSRTMFMVFTASILLGCSEATKAQLDKTFNEDEFTGLDKLNSSYKTMTLDYELDDKQNKPVKFTSCPQVEKTTEQQIQTSEFPLFVLLQINCAAAKYYFDGKQPAKSFFPEKLSLDFIKTLPATFTPNISREDMSRRESKLLGSYEKLELVPNENNALTVMASDNVEITYHIMTRADIDNDSIEDLVIRLDWSIQNSFGKGFDLITLSKTSASAPVKLEWRYTK